MTGNKAYLSDYEDYNGGFVAFGSDPKGGKITGKGKIRTANLDFDDVYFVDELKFNLFSVSQMCDKKNSILFTETECLILSPSFKLLDESQVVLRAPRKDDVYSLDLKNIIPSRGITCLYANATADESKLWHKRLGHVNFKNINKLVKGHLVRGLPSKVFVNDHTCVACKKGKQHKASCKAKLERIIRKPLELLHMDLFGPVSVESINKKRYCLVVTDDFSRFSWVFFLATKDETSEILCKFIIGLENQLNHNVKIIRCDNGTEFKNHAMNEFCAKKGIKREFSVARTPQQNGVAERKNRTLIEAARTMLADSLLPIPFWAEAVNTACYVLNRVLVTKPQNKTPYELLIGNSPSISFMRPFGCPLTILNTLDSLGKFDGKSDEGYLLGYSTTSKAFRVYNKRTKRVEENLHIDFLEDQPNVMITFVEVEDFRRAQPDAIAHSAPKIISRLKSGGEKTTQALKSLCWRSKGLQVEEVAVIGVDSLGFDVRVCSGRQVQTLRFAFKKRASSEYSAERQLNNLLFPRISGKQQKQKEAHQTELFKLGKLISDCSNHISACFDSTSENLRFSVTETLGCVLARDDLVMLCENNVALLEKVGMWWGRMGGICWIKFLEFVWKRRNALMARLLVLPLESFRANVYPLVYGVKSVASGSIEAITKLSRSKSGVDWSKAKRFVGVSDVVTHLASSLDPALIFEVGINMLFFADVPGGKPEWASTSIIAILTLWDRQ
ncbi:putative ribonuclease H-like domain-containing protein [Tanacetum coccineum]